MAEDENKGEETPEQENTETAAESPAPKKAAVKKKAAGKKKKNVKKKAAKQTSAEAQSAATEVTAEKSTAEEMSDTQETPQRAPQPKSFWWRATIMLLLVILLFSFIREMADGPEDEADRDIDTATIPAEVLEPDYAIPQTPAPSGEPTHPWMLPPGPSAQMPGRNAPPHYYPGPQQGGYGYPQQPYGDSGAAPQPYYPGPQQGYYGYPPQHPWQQPPYYPQGEAEGGYPTYPQPYPAPYQQ